MGTPAKPYCRELPPMSRDPQDWVQAQEFIRGRGIDPHVAKLNAWYPSRQAGDDCLRVVIPGTSRDQANQFWQARLVEEGHNPDPNTPPVPVEPTGEALAAPTAPKRYQSPYATRGDALIVLHPDYSGPGNDSPPPGSVLVEGPFDALAAAELGLLGVALMGNNPSAEALEHAVEWLRAAPPAVMVTDGDATVQGATLAGRLLAQYGLKSLLVLSPYPYKDLGEMPLSERRRLFKEAGIAT